MKHNLIVLSPLILLILGQQCCPRIYYEDADGDGYGNPDVWIQTCDPPAGYVDDGTDCDDADAQVNPGMAERCNDGIDDDCNPNTLEEGDQDQDGYSICDGDCDDQDPLRSPGHTELCDGKDNDCNGDVDDGFDPHTWYRDQDGDGFGVEQASRRACYQTLGYVSARGDCDDSDPDIHPGAIDPPDDGLDQDCGGTSGPDPHVGLSESSFSSIQEALDAAPHDTTIWVGPGEYHEHDITFRGKAVRLAATHPAEQTIVDALDAGRGFLFDSHETNASILDGFTITNGSTPDDGGGVYVYQSSPTLIGCRLVNNRAGGAGGAIRMVDAYEVTVEATLIAGNVAPAGGGGAMLSGSDVTWSHCVFQDNETNTSGGGLYLFSGRTAFHDSTLLRNTAVLQGGGLYISIGDLVLDHGVVADNNGGGKGGGLMVSGTTLHMTNSVLDGNEGEKGGNIYFYQPAGTIEHSYILDGNAFDGAGIYFDGGSESGIEVSYTLFSGNVASSEGGAVNLVWSAPTFEQVVMAGNIAYHSGGGVFTEYGPARFERSVLAYNQPSNVGVYDSNADVPTFHECDLYNPPGWTNLPFPVGDTNSLDEPAFLEYGWSDTLEVSVPVDFHLALASPNVDRSTGAFDPDGSPADIGIFGGENADEYDLDGDGFPAYFWPGTYYDPPAGLDPSDYDCEDRHADYQSCL